MQRTGFEIPEQMRRLADERVGEARKAVEDFLDATQKAFANAGGSAKSAGGGAADLSRQSLAYLEENVAASFDFAQRLVHVRTLEELGALQQEFFRRQIEAAAEQGRALAGMAMRAASEPVTRPKK